MTKTKLNFYCPSATVKVLDEMAAADHRDRTSLLNKIIDFYLSHQANGTKPTAAKKKAGTR
jgi:hypothetical protein